jgi:hypothetical protein
MKIDINDVPFEKSKFSFNNGLNFRRFLESSIVEHYKIKMSKSDFLSGLENSSNNSRDEI